MSRLYLTAREYDALLKKQNGFCCVEDCEASDDLIGERVPDIDATHLGPQCAGNGTDLDVPEIT